MPAPASSPHAPRQRWMAVLARAEAAEMEALLGGCPPLPAHTRLRGPEAGLLMVRARAGGGGAPFNLGEMTVTRCTVRTADGQVGHATVAGRDGRRAELAALLDAALQDPGRHAALERDVVSALETVQQARRTTTARKAAATRVQFFTLATMRS